MEHSMNGLIFLVLSASIASAPVRAEDPACTAVYEATARMLATPHHQYQSSTHGEAGGQTQMSEIVSTATSRYLKVGGQWSVSGSSPEKEVQEMQERRKTLHPSCRLVRDETIEGTPARLYSIHNQSEFATSDQRLWVATASGLPVREEIDLNGGEGMVRRLVTRYVYTNVQKPAGLP